MAASGCLARKLRSSALVIRLKKMSVHEITVAVRGPAVYQEAVLDNVLDEATVVRGSGDQEGHEFRPPLLVEVQPVCIPTISVVWYVWRPAGFSHPGSQRV